MTQTQDVMVEAIVKLLDFAARKSSDRQGSDKEFADLREKLKEAAKPKPATEDKPSTASTAKGTSKKTTTKSKQTTAKPKAKSD